VLYWYRIAQELFLQTTYFKLARCSQSCLNAFYEQKRHKIKESELQGFKYFKAISGILESLHKSGCQRDRAGSSFVCRVRDNCVYECLQDYELTPDALAAGIVFDKKVRLGSNRKTKEQLSVPVRLIAIKCTPHKKRYKIGRGGPEQGETLLIATDIFDLEADVIGLIFKHRWAVEIFFRFFKHVLGCRHLLSYNHNGIELQTYAAIIACMLIALWTGRKPTLRTYEMLCWYFTGMADEDELISHIQRLQKIS